MHSTASLESSGTIFSEFYSPKDIYLLLKSIETKLCNHNKITKHATNILLEYYSIKFVKK